MAYKVLIVVKDDWWSDQRPFATFSAAKQHQANVAARWSDCDTAIRAPDGRVLAHLESLLFRQEAAKLRALDKQDMAKFRRTLNKKSKACAAAIDAIVGGAT